MKRSLASRPVCGLCGKPVEEMTEEHDELREEVTFTARCHGARESQTVPAQLIRSVAFTVAFDDGVLRLP